MAARRVRRAEPSAPGRSVRVSPPRCPPGAAGALLLALVACEALRGPVPAAPPVGHVAVEARLEPQGASPRSLSATATVGGAQVSLAYQAADGTFRGALAAPPGSRPVSIEVRSPAALLGQASAPVEVRQGETAQVLAAIAVRGAGEADRPLVATLVSPVGSVVVGDEVSLSARASADLPVAWAWSAEPPGCGRLSDPAAATTAFTAALPGICALRVTATAGPRSDSRTLSIAVRTRGRDLSYPLRPSADGRHLVDRRGTPVLLKGEAAWLSLVNLTEEEQERYLANRAAKGFNAVLVSLLNHDYARPPNPVPPANRYGEEPFRERDDFATPNDAYFDRAAAFVDRAAAHGIAVLLVPAYLGFDGKDEGWWGPLAGPKNSRAACHTFGRYLGEKLGSKGNVVWVAGGDYAPPPGSEGEARLRALLEGMKEAGASQPWTGHWNVGHRGGISTDEALFAPAMDLNGVYQYGTSYEYALRAYDVVPRRPVFVLEGTYEREHPGGLQPFRREWWWGMLSGAAGTVFGNDFVWTAQSARGTYSADYAAADRTVSSWAAELESPGTFQMMRLHQLFEGLPWQRLVPAGAASGLPDPVVSGQRPRALRIASAATRQGDLLVLYVPPARKRSRAFTLSMSGLSGPSRARWFDPTTGQILPAAGDIPNRGTFTFRTPGKNALGETDWVLVVDVPPAAGP